MKALLFLFTFVGANASAQFAPQYNWGQTYQGNSGYTQPVQQIQQPQQQCRTVYERTPAGTIIATTRCF